MAKSGLPSVDPDRPEDWMIEPLDYITLDLLPDEGTNVGLYQIGETVNQLRKKLGEKEISTGSLAARLRMMMIAGYVRKVRMVGTSGTQAWQKTVKGKEVLAAWQAKQ
jgi:DNA-binding HxlR family transcriptional regulator